MEIKIKTVDGLSQMPLPDVALVMTIGEMKWKMPTDEDGSWYRKDTMDYIGQQCHILANKAGYKQAEKTFKLSQEEISISIPLDPDDVQVTFSVKDETGTPISLAKVSLLLDNNAREKKETDSQGIVGFRVPGSYQGRTLPYEIQAGNFQLQKDSINLATTDRTNVVLVKGDVPIDPNKQDTQINWKLVGGILTAGLLILIAFLMFWPEAPPIKPPENVAYGEAEDLFKQTKNLSTKINDLLTGANTYLSQAKTAVGIGWKNKISEVEITVNKIGESLDELEENIEKGKKKAKEAMEQEANQAEATELLMDFQALLGSQNTYTEKNEEIKESARKLSAEKSAIDLVKNYEGAFLKKDQEGIMAIISLPFYHGFAPPPLKNSESGMVQAIKFTFSFLKDENLKNQLEKRATTNELEALNLEKAIEKFPKDAQILKRIWKDLNLTNHALLVDDQDVGLNRIFFLRVDGKNVTLAGLHFHQK